MKITSITLLAIIPFLFGCASTTIKTYSANFKVYPVEDQQYKFESVITETIQKPNGEKTSQDYKTSLTTKLGSKAKISMGEGKFKDGTVKNGTQLEAKLEDLGTQYKAYLKATIQRGDDEPVSCSQTITIQK